MQIWLQASGFSHSSMSVKKNIQQKHKDQNTKSSFARRVRNTAGKAHVHYLAWLWFFKLIFSGKALQQTGLDLGLRDVNAITC